jgi:hypothetical protein
VFKDIASLSLKLLIITNSVVLVRERTIPTERPLASSNFPTQRAATLLMHRQITENAGTLHAKVSLLLTMREMF